MKDNHHITQTVKININNSGNKQSRRRNNTQRNFRGLGGGGGGGGSGGLGGGFSIPPIIHNDNKPDISNVENTLQKQENSLQRIYDNQMMQRSYSNYNRDDEYADYPRLEAPHLSHMEELKDDIYPIEDKVGEDDSDDTGSFHMAPEEPKKDDEEEPFSPPHSITRELKFATPFKEKLKGRKRIEASEMGANELEKRVKREVRLLNRLDEKHPGGHPNIEKYKRNIKADISDIHRQTHGEKNVSHLLPFKFQ